MPKIRAMASAFAAALIGALAVAAPANAVEEPAYRLELKDGAFEIRDYPGLIVAEVTVDGDQTTAANRGFRLLAGYIFGANHGRRAIAMTAPVSQARAQGETIAMTADWYSAWARGEDMAALTTAQITAFMEAGI